MLPWSSTVEHERMEKGGAVHMYSTSSTVTMGRGHGVASNSAPPSNNIWRRLLEVAKAASHTAAASGTSVGSLQTLDPNHSHFILADYGRGGLGSEMKLRDEFETCVCSQDLVSNRRRNQSPWEHP